MVAMAVGRANLIFHIIGPNSPPLATGPPAQSSFDHANCYVIRTKSSDLRREIRLLDRSRFQFASNRSENECFIRIREVGTELLCNQ